MNFKNKFHVEKLFYLYIFIVTSVKQNKMIIIQILFKIINNIQS